MEHFTDLIPPSPLFQDENFLILRSCSDLTRLSLLVCILLCFVSCVALLDAPISPPSSQQFPSLCLDNDFLETNIESIKSGRFPSYTSFKHSQISFSLALALQSCDTVGSSCRHVQNRWRPLFFFGGVSADLPLAFISLFIILISTLVVFQDIYFPARLHTAAIPVVPTPYTRCHDYHQSTTTTISHFNDCTEVASSLLSTSFGKRPYIRKKCSSLQTTVCCLVS